MKIIDISIQAKYTLSIFFFITKDVKKRLISD